MPNGIHTVDLWVSQALPAECHKGIHSVDLDLRCKLTSLFIPIGVNLGVDVFVGGFSSPILPLEFRRNDMFIEKR